MSRKPARTGRGRNKSGTNNRQTRAAREYAQKLRDVQPLVSFQFPKQLRPADKRKLNKYHKYLFADYRHGGYSGITNGVKARVRVKDPERLAKLQEEYGQGRLPGVKYVWIPSIIDPVTNKVVRPKVRHRKTMPNVVSFKVERYNEKRGTYEPGIVETQFLPFDKIALLQDPQAEIMRVTKELADLAGVDHTTAQFRVRNADNEIKETRTAVTMVDKIKFYMSKYPDWEEWLDGLIIDTATSTKTLQEYRRTKMGEIERRKKIRKINTTYVLLLNEISEHKGGAATEVIAQGAYGTIQDAPAVRKLLEEMKGHKLVNGDDNRWFLTQHGQRLLREAKTLLPLYYP